MCVVFFRWWKRKSTSVPRACVCVCDRILFGTIWKSRCLHMCSRMCSHQIHIDGWCCVLLLLIEINVRIWRLYFVSFARRTKIHTNFPIFLNSARLLYNIVALRLVPFKQRWKHSCKLIPQLSKLIVYSLHFLVFRPIYFWCRFSSEFFVLFLCRLQQQQQQK